MKRSVISSLFGYLKDKARGNRQLSLWSSSPKTLPRKKSKSALSASDPELLVYWQSLQAEYFPEALFLHEYKIVWSSRTQKRVLASCNIRRRMVRVAQELNTPECTKWLSPLIYHEMCHAALDPSQIKSKGKIRWHGKEFKALERRHPFIPELDKWIRDGGWRSAVRIHRARRAAMRRRA